MGRGNGKSNAKPRRQGRYKKVVIKGQSLRELEVRRMLCMQAIRIVDAQANDPRREGALKEYRVQLADIDRMITEITGTPPPVVIGLKAADMKARKG